MCAADECRAQRSAEAGRKCVFLFRRTARNADLRAFVIFFASYSGGKTLHLTRPHTSVICGPIDILRHITPYRS